MKDLLPVNLESDLKMVNDFKNPSFAYSLKRISRDLWVSQFFGDRMEIHSDDKRDKFTIVVGVK